MLAKLNFISFRNNISSHKLNWSKNLQILIKNSFSKLNTSDLIILTLIAWSSEIPYLETTPLTKTYWSGWAQNLFKLQMKNKKMGMLHKMQDLAHLRIKKLKIPKIQSNKEWEMTHNSTFGFRTWLKKRESITSTKRVSSSIISREGRKM